MGYLFGSDLLAATPSPSLRRLLRSIAIIVLLAIIAGVGALTSLD